MFHESADEWEALGLLKVESGDGGQVGQGENDEQGEEER